MLLKTLLTIRSHFLFMFVCRKLSVTVDSSDDNYLPSKIVIQGGEIDNLRTLNTVNLDW